ncbi:MAG: hypothetical protein LBE61_03835 [Burkholderiaceae bacterium]|jgi:hypothetical protein|nr:hypothetical protein [Burkholderiaceae bacterium]
MADSTGKALIHRYMHGIRFDGPWEYRIVSPSGRRRWSYMFPDTDRGSVSDPEGLEWCLRRSAAVMTQRPLRSIAVSPSLSTHADEHHGWKALFPGCEIRSATTTGTESMNYLGTALERGGCALLKLVLHRRLHGKLDDTACWVWVVGVEMMALPETTGGNTPRPSHAIRAALVVNHVWSVPWGSGFGARVSWDALGRCILCSVDGERLQGRCAELVTIVPKHSEHAT